MLPSAKHVRAPRLATRQRRPGGTPVRASSCEAAVVVPEAGINEWEPTATIHNDPPYDPATATGRAAHTAEYMPVRRVQLLHAASTHAKARRR